MDLRLFHTALALSSGTISYLIGCTRYDEIYRVQRAFATFCLENPQHQTWVKAWRAFYV